MHWNEVCVDKFKWDFVFNGIKCNLCFDELKWNLAFFYCCMNERMWDYDKYNELLQIMESNAICVGKFKLNFAFSGIIRLFVMQCTIQHDVCKDFSKAFLLYRLFFYPSSFLHVFFFFFFFYSGLMMFILFWSLSTFYFMFQVFFLWFCIFWICDQFCCMLRVEIMKWNAIYVGVFMCDFAFNRIKSNLYW